MGVGVNDFLELKQGILLPGNSFQGLYKKILTPKFNSIEDGEVFNNFNFFKSTSKHFIFAKHIHEPQILFYC